MLVVLLALLAAAGNALASVLQRQGALRAAGSHFVARLVRQPVWLAGILSLICGFALQAAALAGGDLIVVQPILVTELPLSLLAAAAVTGLRPGPRDWGATLEMGVGLGLVLAAAAPSGGHHDASSLRWALAVACTVGLVGALAALSRPWAGAARAALLGAGSGVSFGLSAALLDTAASRGEQGVASLFGSWQLYAMVVAGAGGLYLLQHAFTSGPFMAAQPPATVVDPLTSVGYGILLFGEHMRGGPYLVPELVGAALVAHGAIALSRSALLSPRPPGGRATGDPGPRPRRGGR
ncbi:MAG: DMT family transporter [Acidimicrobiales bacterium]